MTWTYALHFELLFQDKLALVQTAELVDLVLILATDLDLVGDLLIFFGQLTELAGGFA